MFARVTFVRSILALSLSAFAVPALAQTEPVFPPAPAAPSPTDPPPTSPDPTAPVPVDPAAPAPVDAPPPFDPGEPPPVDPAAPPPALPPVTLEPGAGGPLAEEPVYEEEVIEIAPQGATSTVSRSGEEVVTVTGSRISGSTTQQASHVAVITAKDIERTGATTVDEVLRRMPAVSLQGINRSNTNGGDGLATVDLRNLGATRTLVLVNGRRFVSSGGDAVDFNTIPIGMVERIDVLLEGAAVIYGSDAVAGVINIILKDDFDGIRADFIGGISGQGDAEEVGLGVTMGKNHDKGNITLNLQGLIRQPVWQRDRKWSRDSISDRGYLNGYDDSGGIYTIYGSGAVPAGSDGRRRFVPDPATGRSYSPVSPFNKSDRYSFARQQQLMGTQERFQITMLGDYDLTKHSRAFMEGMHTYRHSQQQLAPQPFIGGNSTFPNGFTIPTTNPFIPQDYLATLPASQKSITLLRRNTDVGNRIFDQDVNTTRAVFGLAGDVPKYEIDWEIYGNFGISRATETTSNSINLARAIESADPVACAANAATGCVVGDFFGEKSLQPGALDYIRYQDVATNGYSQLSSGASLSAKPVDLWGAGKLGLAGGLLYRREAGYNQPSPVTIGGESAGNGLEPTRGHFNSYEGFLETAIPLLSNLPGAHDLSIDLAARMSYYDSFGSKLTWRVSGVYAPVEDFKIRGTYSKAFRNPAISDLFGGAADSYETLTDPCNNWDTAAASPEIRANCMAAGVPTGYNQNDISGSQIRTNIGGNEKLEAETADVWDIGLVLTPTFLPKEAGVFTASVDYYQVNVDNAIANPQPQFLLDSCYNSPGFDAESCKDIGRGGNGAINRLQARLLNIGKTETAGIDASANYDFGLGSIGLPSDTHLILGWQGNRLLYYDDTIYGEKVRYDKTITAGSGTYTHWRWTFNTTVAGENWSATSTNRYIGGAKYFQADWGTIPDDWVDQVMYWDLSAQYTFENNLTVIGGVSNLLDQTPPFFLDGSSNSNANTYDFVGRYFFTRAIYKM